MKKWFALGVSVDRAESIASNRCREDKVRNIFREDLLCSAPVGINMADAVIEK
jgi:hypothetical protein